MFREIFNNQYKRDKNAWATYVALCGHTARHTTEDDIGDAINDACQSVISFAGCNTGDDVAKTGKDL